MRVLASCLTAWTCGLLSVSASARAAAPASDPPSPAPAAEPAVAAPGDDAPTPVTDSPESAPTPEASTDSSSPASQPIADSPADPEPSPDPSEGAEPSESPDPSEGAEPSVASDPPVDDPQTEAPAQDRKPPRIAGPYIGLGFTGGLSFARVNQFSTDTPFAGAGGYLRFGQMVLPWFGVGLQIGGQGGSASEDGARQQLGQGALLVDFNVVPAPQRVRGLSLRGSFGFGGGAVNEEGIPDRAGYGGAVFGLGARYEFFPGAHRYRATKAGGFGIGPELAWLGFTPAAKGRPMSNTLWLGLSATFYFGN